MHDEGRDRLGHLRLLVRGVLRVLHLLRRQQQRQQQLRRHVLLPRRHRRNRLNQCS